MWFCASASSTSEIDFETTSRPRFILNRPRPSLRNIHASDYRHYLHLFPPMALQIDHISSDCYSGGIPFVKFEVDDPINIARKLCFSTQCKKCFEIRLGAFVVFHLSYGFSLMVVISLCT